MTDRQVVVGVAMIREGRVLVALRPGPEGGWEFPGGKVEPGESERAAGARELEEELGVMVEVGEPLGIDSPIGDHYLLRVYLAELIAGDPVPHEHAEVRWIGPAELGQLGWLPADRPFLPVLRAKLMGNLIRHDSDTSGPGA
ncbi:8-oxo-dGTP diphosphatase [Kribbella sp. VKM Ac-2527]|uniref:8-oxo-dGTP diphosphatase n=1 Tax=Kribbella caucasensis TaxID=2512215 RepID=A0A4V6PT18_9ACTN|nr:(deoxy)nucleoside triphosphate pyrophosphohydrolase [Kribbella sp. VKM Ac-2527]TDO44974.1 8-oxo-dGTP diphosphatase [Kribbella sp. VKM Ac-2527]